MSRVVKSQITPAPVVPHQATAATHREVTVKVPMLRRVPANGNLPYVPSHVEVKFSPDEARALRDIADGLLEIDGKMRTAPETLRWLMRKVSEASQ